MLMAVATPKKGRVQTSQASQGRMAEQEAGSDAGADANVMRIGKRVFVSNLAWKSSWQDLKVGC